MKVGSALLVLVLLARVLVCNGALIEELVLVVVFTCAGSADSTPVSGRAFAHGQLRYERHAIQRTLLARGDLNEGFDISRAIWDQRLDNVKSFVDLDVICGRDVDERSGKHS